MSAGFASQIDGTVLEKLMEPGLASVLHYASKHFELRAHKSSVPERSGHFVTRTGPCVTGEHAAAALLGCMQT